MAEKSLVAVLLPTLFLTACAGNYKAPVEGELGEIRIRNEMSQDIVITMARDPLNCIGFTRTVSNIGKVEDHYFKVPLGEPVTLKFEPRIKMFSSDACTGIVSIQPRSKGLIEITVAEHNGVCAFSSEFSAPYVYVRQHLEPPVKSAQCAKSLNGTATQ